MQADLSFDGVFSRLEDVPEAGAVVRAASGVGGMRLPELDFQRALPVRGFACFVMLVAGLPCRPHRGALPNLSLSCMRTAIPDG
jgi:hypothetical protein